MNDPHLLIIGGGLAGLATGCYARRSGFKTTIVEHNLALGGVCTAWQRGHYTIDGCIHWLTGGRFLQLYQELGILSQVQLRTLQSWVTYRNVKDSWEFAVSRDLDELVARLVAISPADAGELCRLREAANEARLMQPPLDAPELGSFGEQLRSLWDLRAELGLFLHYRKPMGTWAREHLHSPRLQRAFTALLPETAPAFVLPMILGYLAQGDLSRPVGGTAAFRRALEHTYRELGGAARLHSTVDEVLVDGGRACGVRLGDGEILQADAIVSTASMPETMLRLLGGRYEAQAMQERLTRWKLFEPIVLVSFGVEQPYPEVPPLLLIDGIEPVEIGGQTNQHLYIRVGNDDPCFAPTGHCVVQAMLRTDYTWWATRGSAYHAAKDDVAAAALTQLEPYLPNLRSAVRTVDVATPLTYWNMARSWRGAYEGWLPSADSLFSHVSKKLHGLDNFYMAGQWVAPGGGVPTALMTGRHAVQLLCADEKRPFVAGG
jgi:phytoene dehydrogenase-like protein